MAGPAGVNPYARLVDEAEGLDKIEELQNHNNEDIYDKVVSIMETFFDVEDGEVENLAPQAGPLALLPFPCAIVASAVLCCTGYHSAGAMKRVLGLRQHTPIIRRDTQICVCRTCRWTATRAPTSLARQRAVRQPATSSPASTLLP